MVGEMEQIQSTFRFFWWLTQIYTWNPLWGSYGPDPLELRFMRRSSPLRRWQRSSVRSAPHSSPPQTSSRSSNIRSDVKRCPAEPGPPSPHPPSTPSPPPPPPPPRCSLISSLRRARGTEPSLQLWKSKQSLWVPGPIVIHRADKYLIPSKDTFC